MNASHQRRQSRGISLIEVLVVMAFASTMMTLSATWIARSMSMHTRLRHYGETIDSRWRLAETFRRDIHSHSLKSVNNKRLVLLGNDATDITYQVVDDSLTRTSGDVTQHFLIRKDAIPHWKVDDDGLVTLKIGKGQSQWICSAMTNRHTNQTWEWSP